MNPSQASSDIFAPDWTPAPEFIAGTNMAWLMRRTGCETYEALHAWSVLHREEYWALASERLGIQFIKPCERVMDLSQGVEQPRWLSGSRMNIVDSCFAAPPEAPDILWQPEGGSISTVTYAELKALTGRVAANIRRLGYQPGDAMAILLPMTVESVAVYLGIIAAGCVVVGVADSFRPREIATRLQIANTVAVFTQDVMIRGGKTLPLYTNAVEADAPTTIVIPAQEKLAVTLRGGDIVWNHFLKASAPLTTVPRAPDDATNILFSSGTTGEPKAIPWTQVTPLKPAVDSHFHQNIQPGDVLVWPTNIGWMMGPWLIFAALINRAAMGLFYGAPTGREFGQFVQEVEATMLGVVPSLVKTWRHSGCMEGLDWTGLKLFSSTGECSSASDMQWLMRFAGGRPVVEYCGGTEIGGAYISTTLTLPNIACVFNTPTLGLDVVILDDDGNPSDSGELFVSPPSIGLSNTLLNKDHHEVYYSGTPKGPDGGLLRRHGDQMERLPNGWWRAKGRADDTMNLGGIKVSSAEIEQTLQAVPGVVETAAIGISPDGGPCQLIIYVVCKASFDGNKEGLAAAMQSAIKTHLNPLFKIHYVIIVPALPRTASNKVMRRELRALHPSAA